MLRNVECGEDARSRAVDDVGWIVVRCRLYTVEWFRGEVSSSFIEVEWSGLDVDWSGLAIFME